MGGLQRQGEQIVSEAPAGAEPCRNGHDGKPHACVPQYGCLLFGRSGGGGYVLVGASHLSGGDDHVHVALGDLLGNRPAFDDALQDDADAELVHQLQRRQDIVRRGRRDACRQLATQQLQHLF
ncbi:MAG: hypothetical protein ACE5R4_00175 [Armatimonadota bacterium]